MRTLDRERWKRIDAMLDAALDLDPPERDAYVSQACAGEPDLLIDVQTLLAGTAGPSIFDRPALERAAPLVAAAGDSASDDDPLLGRTIGAYRLVRALGEGGMGVVYLAERADGAFRQQVAIKLAKQGLRGEQARRRFLQERQILANLQHDAIAKLLDGGVTADGVPYFVMERVVGVPVTAHCQDRRLKIGERLALFLEICDAVQYAHRNLVVHRDLKPSNILVDDGGHVKLLDFGIAKLLGDDSMATLLTQTRALTPEYAAPEQLTGGAISTSIDVYALGVLLCEMLTAERPYRLRPGVPAGLERAIVEDDPLPPSLVTADRESKRQLAGDLDRIVLKALQKSPDRRYASAEAFAADVQRHLNGLPVLAQRDMLTYRASKFLRRHRVGVTAAALVALSLAGGLVATVAQMRKAQREAEQSRAVQEFLISVFSASAPDQAQGHPPSARELLDRGAARIARELEHQPEARGRLSRILGRIYRQLGEYDRAIPLLESSLASEGSGADAIEFADTLDLLAMTTYQKSDFQRALVLGERALDAARRASGPDSLQAARIANDVAWIRRRLGEYGEAERLRQFAVEIYRKRLGADAPETVTVENDLGVLLADLGRFDAAEQLQRRVVDAHRRRLGGEHPDTLNATYQLARAEVENGKPDDAADLLRQILPVQRRVLGERHDRIAMSLRMLAWALDDAGDYSEALRDADEAVALQKARLGAGDAQVGVTLRRRAEIEGHQQRFAEAERDIRESLAILTARFGENNYDIGATRHVLAWVQLGQRRLDEAAAEAERALANRRRYHGEGHPRVADTLDLLGDIETMRGDRARALTLHEAAFKIEHDRLRPDHPMTRRTEAHLRTLR